MAQTRQRQHLAKVYPDDLKAQKGPSDRACHFGQGCKRYDLHLFTLPHILSNFFLTIIRVCDHFNNVADQHEKCNAYFL